jgi:hypothetical protein
LPVGIHQVLGEPVEVGKRLRSVIFQAALSGEAMIEVFDQGRHLEHGLIRVGDQLTRLLAGRDKGLGYRPNILKAVGNGLAVLLRQQVIEVLDGDHQPVD